MCWNILDIPCNCSQPFTFHSDSSDNPIAFKFSLTFKKAFFSVDSLILLTKLKKRNQNMMETYFRSLVTSFNSIACFSCSSASHSASVSYLQISRIKMLISKLFVWRTGTRRWLHFQSSMPNDVLMTNHYSARIHNNTGLKSNLQRSCYFSLQI